MFPPQEVREKKPIKPEVSRGNNKNQDGNQ